MSTSLFQVTPSINLSHCGLDGRIRWAPLTIRNSLISPDRQSPTVECQRRNGMGAAIDGNSNQLIISVWFDHLSNSIESAGASVHSGVSIETSVCGWEEHIEPEYGASAI